MGNSLASSRRPLSPTPVPTFKEFLDQNPVAIMSTTVCPYCTIAKNLFRDLGTTYKSIELDQFPREQAKEAGNLVGALREATHQTTVPQIFICGQWIGGCAETKLLLKSGKLEEILKACCDGDVTCSNGNRV